MASWLVFCDELPVRWDALRARWPQLEVGEADAENPDDADGAMVFVVVTTGERATVVATFESPDAYRELAHDITPLLGRLGLRPGVPHVLPPSDVELLRYVLRLDDRELPPATEAVLEGDPVADSLRAAAIADDEVLAIYADYLSDHGDPRGELILLQRARERGGGPITSREHVLVERYGAGTLQPYLDPDFTLRRGFLARCATIDRMPAHAASDPAWETVTDLATSSHALLTSPRLLRCTRIWIDEDALAALATHPAPLPFEVILGRSAWPRSTGLRVGTPRIWAAFAHDAALVKLRTLSLDDGSFMLDLRELIAAPLGRRLSHLDLDGTYEPFGMVELRTLFAASELQMISTRWRFSTLNIALALVRDPETLVVELDGHLGDHERTKLLEAVAPLERRLPVVVHDVRTPQLVTERQLELLEALDRRFDNVSTAVTSRLADLRR